MYTKPVKDPTLLNLFVPDINAQSESKNTQEEFILLNSIIDNNCFTTLEETSNQTTALVVKKDFAILNPQLIFTVKKSIKLSIRSFLISLSLTFLNFFI